MIIPEGQDIKGNDGEELASDVKLSLDEGRCDLVLFVNGEISEVVEEVE
jgi:hypothetical protein